MASDYGNDEMIESSFPADSGDESSQIDAFGVWVKSGPRNSSEAESAPEQQNAEDGGLDEELPELHFLLDEEEKSEAETENSSETDDLVFDIPDFQDMTAESAPLSEGAAFDAGAESFEGELAESQAISGGDAGLFEESAGDLKEIDLSNFFDSSPETSLVSGKAEDKDGEAESEAFDFEEIDFDQLTLDEEPESSEARGDFQEPALVLPDSEIEPFSESYDSVIESAQAREEAAESAEGEQEIDLSAFIDGFEEPPPEKKAAPTTPAAASSEDIDLDDFISAFNESGGEPKSDGKLFDDYEPLDLDLEFDDEFIAESQKMYARGASSRHSQFFDSDLGVEVLEELPGKGTSVGNGFEAMPASEEDAFSETRETAEFDDFLDSLENSPPPEEVLQAAAAKAASAETAPEGGGAAENNVDFPQDEEYTSQERDILFDDIGALEQDLESSDHENGDDMNDKSNELLLSIVEELSAIKEELANLKTGIIQPQAPSPPFADEEPQAPLPEGSATSEQETEFRAAPPESEEPSAWQAPDNNWSEEAVTAVTEDELSALMGSVSSSFEKESAEAEDELVSESVSTAPLEEEIPEVEVPAFEDDISDLPAETEEVSSSSAETLSSPPEELDKNFAGLDFDNMEMSHITSIDDESGYLSSSEESEPNFEDVAMEEPALETIDFEHESLEEPELDDFSIDIEQLSAPAEQGQLAETSPEETAVQVEAAEPEEATENEEAEVSDLTNLVFEMPADVDDAELADEDLMTDLLQTGAEEDSVEAALPLENAEATLDAASANAEPVPAQAEPVSTSVAANALPTDLKEEIKSVLSYMDQLLENLPEEKIEEFARSKYFEVYKKLFEDLGIS